jgi:glycosyltransferase involved in cell wall biosynthesis
MGTVVTEFCQTGEATPVAGDDFVNSTNILFVCDFPPSNHQGGSILASRLLSDYPANRLTVLTGTAGSSAAPGEGRLRCRHKLFPTMNETGRWGIGRLKSAISWLLLPVLALTIIWQIKIRHINLSISIAHGHFFIAAALASLMTSTRLILIVHDDWVADTSRNAYLLKYFAARLFGFAARRADYVYAVSETMQELLSTTYAVKAELQLPATERYESTSVKQNRDTAPDCLRIVYSGICHTAYVDGLNVLIDVLKSETLATFGIRSWELHLYSPLTPEEARQIGWTHQGIKLHGWVPQDDLRQGLSEADILFAPLTFNEDLKYFVERSFPSKTADYLASRKPVLIRAPRYSSLVKYARPLRFAEIVDEPEEENLVKGILKIWTSADYRRSLAANAARAFSEYHDINAQRASFRRIVSQLTNSRSKGNQDGSHN